jgi:hypothetical protein
MVKVYAFINHGDWKVYCPRCEKATQIGLSTNKYICLACWPGIMATALQEVETVTNGIRQKVLRPVPDLAARQEATVAARQAQEEYNIEFPQHAQEITDVINSEPVIEWRCWYPDRPEIRAKRPGANAFGQSLADMQYEHAHHGARP